MRRIVFNLITTICVSLAQAAEDGRFRAVEIYLESIDPIAAWQFELTDLQGQMSIVGVENGESPAFADAPYYDREAVRQGSADRIVVADFSLAKETDLPRGRIRLATLHVMMTEPDTTGLSLKLIAATNSSGQAVAARISLSRAADKENHNDQTQ